MCGSVHVQQATSGNQSFNMRELVLDVPQGTAVLLRRKVTNDVKIVGMFCCRE